MNAGTTPLRPNAHAISAAADDAGLSGDAAARHAELLDPLLDCLAQVARLHGRPWSAQALGAGLPFQPGRFPPALLTRAAARAGLSARLVRRPLEQFAPGLLPAILLLQDNRACVLHESDARSCRVSYPEAPGSIVTVGLDELQAVYAGIACFAHPLHRVDGRAPRPRPVRHRHWFWNAVIQNRRLYRDALAAALLVNLFAMAMPLFTMNVYDRVVPNHAVETLWVLAVGISLVVVFNLVLSTLRAHVVDTASKRIDVQLSAQIMERVLDLRMEGRPASVGAFAANLRSFESVRDFIASATLTTLVDLPFTLLFLLVLLWISPLLVVPALIGILLILLVSLTAQMRMEELTAQSFQASAQRNATLVEALASLEAVKTLNAQHVIQRNWERASAFIAHVGSRLKLLSSGTVNFVQAVLQLASIGTVIIGVYLIQEAALSMGALIAATMITGRCLAPLSQVAGLIMQYQNARTSLASIDNYMKLPAERAREGDFLHRPGVQGALEFRDVTFCYPGAAEPALKGVSFKIAPGERVGIIGRIGSGKSTLEKLMLGLYQPSEGAVLIDGVDVRQLDPIDLRRAIGYVPQDPTLFYGTLRQNIAMGAPGADDAAILEAARLAGLGDFVNRHPQGFDMPIGERGDSLSGGQRQAVAIARALVNDPVLLMLDEPTSNMDPSSEKTFKDRLANAARGKTMLLVTHRTALLDCVDRILVMDGGRLIRDGQRDQVLASLRPAVVPVGARA
ncbi:Toxin RTX-I translocation ATP-binding protein [Pigmentiphaga humi]|uniref:Cyclolysin secretion/processing ATP-binding protein CyaB n=1 Tax=Pigmentiphaga humi TaxID=2478468 RepID=A0A3P4B0T2_9BURK|nr:type I secretion system permease/ATPase [Pigmentiphaga humi]VCU69258.1 Toxin RTX-I translocation ATP-binding protein [Pigmentiphaga humi]